jgi:hypothetical protein
MGIPDSSRCKRGKEPGMEDAADLIVAAKLPPEHPVGAAFCKDLIEIHVFLGTDVVTYDLQPLSEVSRFGV